MNYRTKSNKTQSDSLPKLIEPVLKDQQPLIDNLFAEVWKQLNVSTLLSRAGIVKRSGHEVGKLVFLHLLWRWLGSSSIGFFCQHSMQQFYQAHHSAIYDLLNNPKLNWRSWYLSLAKVCVDRNARGLRALVVDDSIKQRRSKKMDAVSVHYDHTENRFVKGHQAVALGLSCETGYFPLDCELSVSETAPQAKGGQPVDGRSCAMRRYKDAVQLSKLELVAKMVRRAIRRGIQASYLVADSWFGNKAMMRLAVACGLTGVLRMKNSQLKYRVETDGGTQMLTASEIYRRKVRGRWHKVDLVPEGGKWQTYEVPVEINLATSKSEPEQWHAMKLLFVRGVNLDTNTTSSKRDWALFLSTDAQLSAVKMLEIYAMRWAIEVFFREAKQHLKWLEEQSLSYASHAASLHFSSVCYLILVHAKASRHLESLPQARKLIQETAKRFNYARQLWQAFRVIVHQAVDRLQPVLGTHTTVVLQAIDQHMEKFLEQTLQLDSLTISQEHEPVEALAA